MCVSHSQTKIAYNQIVKKKWTQLEQSGRGRSTNSELKGNRSSQPLGVAFAVTRLFVVAFNFAPSPFTFTIDRFHLTACVRCLFFRTFTDFWANFFINFFFLFFNNCTETRFRIETQFRNADSSQVSGVSLSETLFFELRIKKRAGDTVINKYDYMLIRYNSLSSFVFLFFSFFFSFFIKEKEKTILSKFCEE